MPRSAEDQLAAVREGLVRLDPAGAAAAAAEGALLVDIRYGALRDRDGTIPGAVIVERNELEWRLDPQSDYRIPQAVGHDLHVVVICNEGYASSLAAASLQDIGIHRATDLDGGFQSWRAAGLPVTPPTGEPTVRTPYIGQPDAGGASR
ncbi:rhodanese-like domain-containing protein [Actinacidiphila sp. ITFR-21]|uniref:rhodanese-like domain-containing protein n=1 Tax=Actinacidiphila sp. ITFR-21 TaxID=3075199 RepID=UPI00288A0C1A|nr:rhodanese-like domain-containing protein [Streptomyces sp. ITFR-21]WNI16064.1 rhodanese-like domain-containing protein [Streptomyces sp. ITFR-21]